MFKKRVLKRVEKSFQKVSKKERGGSKKGLKKVFFKRVF